MVFSPALLYESSSIDVDDRDEVEFGVFEHIDVLIVSVDIALVKKFKAVVKRNLGGKELSRVSTSCDKDCVLSGSSGS